MIEQMIGGGVKKEELLMEVIKGVVVKKVGKVFLKRFPASRTRRLIPIASAVCSLLRWTRTVCLWDHQEVVQDHLAPRVEVVKVVKVADKSSSQPTKTGSLTLTSLNQPAIMKAGEVMVAILVRIMIDIQAEIAGKVDFQF